MVASEMISDRCFRTHPFLFLPLVFLAGLLAIPDAWADQLHTVERQITSSTAYETTPTLGNDGTTDLVVYTKRDLLAGGAVTPGDIYYQRLVGGAPSGAPVQVTSGPTDDQLNDVCGDYIVYTAYDSVTSSSGEIVVYEISNGLLHTLGTASIIQEPKIHGGRVVWREGGVLSAAVIYFELSWLGQGGYSPLALAGPIPPTFDVQIGSRFVVWAEFDGDYDVFAYDFAAMNQVQVTDTPAINERQPATTGDWIVWEQDQTSIAVHNMATHEQVTIDNGGGCFNPSADGDLIAWESDVSGNLDIWVHRLSVGESYAVTTDPADQYLNDVFGDLVAYVDLTTGSEDIYVSTLEFVPDEPVLLIQQADDSGRYSSTGFHNPADTDYTAVVGGSRSFFVFDLTSVMDPRPIVAASLILETGTVSGGTFGGIDYTLYEVSTPVMTLVEGGDGLTAIYDDLGSGVALSAETEIAPGTSNTEIAIPLLPAGVARLEAAKGDLIAIGGGPTGLAGNLAFNGTDVTGARLRIEFGDAIVPLFSPIALYLVLPGLLVAAGLMAMRRRGGPTIGASCARGYPAARS